jgi:hypothetical protein
VRRFRKLIIILSPVLCFLIIWGIALSKCEILTQIHGNEFAEIYKENTMLGDMEYLKVLDYSKDRAHVYYVSLNYSSANILTFEKANEKWRQSDWKTVWSTSGSADNVVWPYWLHFFYAHPRL